MADVAEVMKGALRKMSGLRDTAAATEGELHPNFIRNAIAELEDAKSDIAQARVVLERDPRLSEEKRASGLRQVSTIEGRVDEMIHLSRGELARLQQT